MGHPSMTLLAVTVLVGLLASAAMAQYKDAYQAGQAKQRDGKHAEARPDFEAALKLAATGPERADAQIGLGFTYEAEKNFSGARAEFAKVLAIADATPDQRAQAHYSIGTGHCGEKNYAAARAELAKVLVLEGVSTAWKAQAQMLIGHSWARESENKLGEARKACADALIAYAKVSDIPGVSPGQKAEARMAAVNTLSSTKSYADARAGLKAVLEDKDVSPATKARAQVLLGKSYFQERSYSAARDELAQAVTMEGVSASDKAEAQLHIGLSYYEAQDYVRAKPELEKVLTMPGADEKRTHEATLRLRLRKLMPGDEKVLTVLFLGASHTQVWRIPQMVEALAASAPAGRPRILAGEYLRGGTSISKFWEEGTGPDTARAKLAAEPWDFLVFECYPCLFGYDECAKYAAKFVTLARAGNVTPILFDAPVPGDTSPISR